MRYGVLCIALIAWACSFSCPFWPDTIHAARFRTGQTIVLQAHKPIGVPLHHRPEPSYWKHVPDKTLATIRQIHPSGRWLSIQLPTGETGWVHRKYVQTQAADVPATPDTPSAEEIAVLTSPRECRNVIDRGGRMERTADDTIRFATWNLRWFPRGHPPDTQDSKFRPTNLPWLVCTLVWMQVDLLAVQESLATPEADEAWNRVMRALKEKTGQSWRWYRQPCGEPEAHHLVIAWNDSRLALSRFDLLWQFNAKARSPDEACASGLRPGLYAYARSRHPHGADFHLIVVHLKSGPTAFALEERHRALNRIDQVTPTLLATDEDIIILGDFNTMGAGDRRSQRYELKSLKRLAAKEQPGFDDLPATPSCTQYFRGRGGRLDHVLVAKDMHEVLERTARVTGYCAVAGCAPIRTDYPLAYRWLSDHCPVVVDIANRDDD